MFEPPYMSPLEFLTTVATGILIGGVIVYHLMN